jgi:hypothetical protein
MSRNSLVALAGMPLIKTQRSRAAPALKEATHNNAIV